MSQLKTYTRGHLDGGVEDWDIVHLDPNTIGWLKPGDLVTNRHYGGNGIVVSVDNDTLVVLWSVPPIWTNVRLPSFRRVFPHALAQQLVAVQPMTAPVGSVFYTDYTYGNDVAGCNNGSRVGRIQQWMSSTSRRCRSWLCSCLPRSWRRSPTAPCTPDSAAESGRCGQRSPR